MKKAFQLFLTGWLLGGCAPLLMASTETARPEKAMLCQACHGIDGYSLIPSYPHLAGQHKKYLINALHAYRDNKRKSAEMAAIVKALTEDDIIELAEYYSQL